MKINNFTSNNTIIDYANKSKSNTIPVENKKQSQNNCDVYIQNNDATNNMELVNSTLKQLKATCSDINLCIGDFASKEDIIKYAKNIDNQCNNIILSHSFIEKMGSSYESYEKCKKLLEELFADASAAKNSFFSSCAYIDEKSITFWNVYNQNPLEKTNQYDNILEGMKAKKQEVKEVKDKLKTINTKSVLKIPGEVYSKLAQANTVAQVKGVISISYSNMFRLQQMLRSCEDKDKNRINAAVRQIGKAITRAHRKISDLNKEQNINLEHKKAIRLRELKKARSKKAELERRRAIRRVRESAQIDEGNPWYFYPQDAINKHGEDMYEKYQAINLFDISFSQSEALPMNSGASASIGTNASPVIAISQPIAISI